MAHKKINKIMTKNLHRRIGITRTVFSLILSLFFLLPAPIHAADQTIRPVRIASGGHVVHFLPPKSCNQMKQ